MNFLQQWELQYRKKMIRVVEENEIDFSMENIHFIILATSFKELSRKYPDYCPYYPTGKSCHPEVADLNCFLCACPNYLSERLKGGCTIESKFGRWEVNRNLPVGRVWDCSNCRVNHSPREAEVYLRDNLNLLRESFGELGKYK